MARTQMTNFELQNISLGIQELQKHLPAISFLLKEKIDRFFKQNHLSLLIIDKKKNDLAAIYCLLDAEGKPMLEEKDGEKHFKFLNEDGKNLYIEALEQFLQRTVYVES